MEKVATSCVLLRAQVHQAGTFAQALRESLRWLSSHAGFESPLLKKGNIPTGTF